MKDKMVGLHKKDQSLEKLLQKGKRKKVIKMLKVYSAINTKKLQRHLEDRAKLREIETIISTDLYQLLVLLCSIIMQQYTLQCTIHRDSSATPPLSPDQQHIEAAVYEALGQDHTVAGVESVISTHKCHCGFAGFM